MAPDPLALEVRRLAALVEAALEESRYLALRLLEVEDRAIGKVMLPLIAEVMGDATFVPASLVAAVLNRRDSCGQALRELIRDHGTDEDGGWRSLGRLLERLDRKPLAGYRLMPDRQTRAGMSWRVVQVSGREKAQA